MNKESMFRIVRTCRKAMNLSEVFSSKFANGGMTIFDEIYGDLEDCLFMLNGEHTSELKESSVDKLLRNNDLSDEDVTETLFKLISARKEGRA